MYDFFLIAVADFIDLLDKNLFHSPIAMEHRPPTILFHSSLSFW